MPWRWLTEVMGDALRIGAPPRASNEVVVDARLLQRCGVSAEAALGRTLEFAGGSKRRIVGVADALDYTLGAQPLLPLWTALPQQLLSVQVLSRADAAQLPMLQQRLLTVLRGMEPNIEAVTSVSPRTLHERLHRSQWQLLLVVLVMAVGLLLRALRAC